MNDREKRYNFLFIFVSTTKRGMAFKSATVTLYHQTPTFQDILDIQKSAKEDDETEIPMVINWMRLAD